MTEQLTLSDSKTNHSMVVVPHIKKDDTSNTRKAIYPRLTDKAVLIWVSLGRQRVVGEAESPHVATTWDMSHDT